MSRDPHSRVARSLGVDVIQLRQPRGSYSCGQYCVAMVTGGDVSRVIKILGHEWRTRWSDIRKALTELRVRHIPHSVTITKNPKPKQCIVRVMSKTDPGWSHYVVFSHGYWYDPSFGPGEGQKRHPLWEPNMYQASYLELIDYDSRYRPPEEKRRIVQEPIYADDWQKLEPAAKNKIVENVFAIAGACDSLGQAWQVARWMTKEGYAFEWLPFDKAFYCDVQRGEDKFIGYGPTLSESLCAASLVATGFLLQRGKPANKLQTHESKAKA